MNNKFNKLKNKNNIRGALDIVDNSVIDEDKKQEVKNDDDTPVLRSYLLTKGQIKLLQQKKVEEINLTLSEIVGKAIEAYCKK